MSTNKAQCFAPAIGMIKRAFRLAGVPAVVALGLLAVFVLAGPAGARTARSAVAPTNTAPPTVSGATTQGQVLTATTGSWGGTAPFSYSYVWQRCDSTGGSCAAISGATEATYSLVGPDVSNTLRVAVTATNADGSGSETSVPTAVVAAVAVTAVPVNTSPPTISGTVQEGQTLTAAAGSWTGSGPITYQYVWLICGADGGACHAIAGASSQTYPVRSGDAGNTVRVAVTATNAGGAKSATSVPTARVAGPTAPAPAPAPTPAATGCTTNGGTVAIAGITSPAHLAIDQFQITPSTITHSTGSLSARFHVSACGGSVQGALVYVTAVPYGMFGGTNEQVTDAAGWATLTFAALRGFPVSQKQQLLVMFVRARKAGENILGGISARRLVSFKVSLG